MPLPHTRGVRTKDSLEARRARGEISCAECRRHKLRCDKSIPCSTCVRKGCQAVCPNGTMTSPQGSRQTAADAEARRNTMLQMSNRIRQLEDALQISHSSVSSAAHPLLSEDLLEIKDHINQPIQPKKDSNSSDDDVFDSAGTLAVLERGIESYVGTHPFVFDRFGSAEAIHFKLKPNVPPPASYLSGTFPFTPAYLPTQEIQALITERLPSFERASALVEAYLENISWLMRSVDREQIVEELIPEVYRRRGSSGNNTSNSATPIDPHALSLLLAIFACGAVADLTLPPWNEEADLYYHLSLTAISLKPVFDGVSLNAIQTLGILGSYDVFCCRKNSLEGAWKMISFCMSLSASIGLHRDPAHFKLPPKIVQRRRRVFWEIYSMDMWKCMGSGRPTVFTPAVIDCELPEDKEATLAEDGTVIPSLWRIRYRFSKEVMTDVTDQLCAARAMKYSEILALDQRVRDFGPQHVVDSAISASIPPDEATMSNPLKRIVMVLLKESILLLLHRSFFVRALIENPTDPMRSHFAPSFLSVFRSAMTLLHVFREFFEGCSHFFVRLWPIWAHILSATVMLGSIASCGTTSALAPQAYVELNLAIDMLSKMQINPLIQCGLPMILRLRAQAYQALAKHGNAIPAQPPFTNLPPRMEEDKDYNVISGFGRILRGGFERGSMGSGRQLSDMLNKSMPSSGQQTPTRASAHCSIPTVSVYSMPSPFDSGVGPGAFASREYASVEYEGTAHRTQSSGRGDTPSSSTVRGTPIMDAHVEQLQASPQPDTYATETQGSLTHQVTGASDTQKASKASHTDPLNNFGSSCHTTSLASGSGIHTPYAKMPPQDLHEQSQLGEPMTSDALLSLSPSTVFNTDFDVSFNMRASAGDESVLPLLSEDLEAWRTILQDSRFFGIADCASDNETRVP